MAEILRTDVGVPPGWTRIVKMRTSGATVGHVDIYIIAPDNTRFRSRNELRKYLTATGNKRYSLEDFDFTRKSISKDVIASAAAVGGSGAADVVVGSPRTKKTKKEKKVSESPKVAAESRPRAAKDSGKDKKKKHRESKDSKSERPSAADKPKEKGGKKISPYNFMLERYTDCAWKFMVAAMFKEQCGCCESGELRCVVERFFQRFPDAGTVAEAGWTKLESFLSRLSDACGDAAFARRLAIYSYEFAKSDDEHVGSALKADELAGVTEYAAYCYKIFFEKDFSKTLRDLDHAAIVYRDYVINRRAVQSAMKDGRMKAERRG